MLGPQVENSNEARSELIQQESHANGGRLTSGDARSERLNTWTGQTAEKISLAATSA